MIRPSSSVEGWRNIVSRQLFIRSNTHKFGNVNRTLREEENVKHISKLLKSRKIKIYQD